MVLQQKQQSVAVALVIFWFSLCSSKDCLWTHFQLKHLLFCFFSSSVCHFLTSGVMSNQANWRGVYILKQLTEMSKAELMSRIRLQIHKLKRRLCRSGAGAHQKAKKRNAVQAIFSFSLTIFIRITQGFLTNSETRTEQVGLHVYPCNIEHGHGCRVKFWTTVHMVLRRH